MTKNDNFDKINNSLGWSPKINFEKGIEETIAWYLKNQNWWRNIIDNNYNRVIFGHNPEKNEILKDKVKHLESFNRFLAWYGSKFVDGKLNEDEGYGKAFFEAHNHITKKNKNGNLITYYTKETKIK